MTSQRSLTLRIQSAEGTKRIQVTPSDCLKTVYDKTIEVFNFSSGNQFNLHFGPKRQHVPSSKVRTVRSSGLNHGDLLFLKPTDNGSTYGEMMDVVPGPSRSRERQNSVSSVSSVSSIGVVSTNKSNVEEDPIDIQLWSEDGKIQRGRDAKLCRHGENGRCIHCSPLEPFDEAYLKEQKIKHLSFHSYLRKLTAGADRGKFVCLEDLNCRVRSGCKDHPPWPQGICSKCQPSAITLNRQSYRHIDNVMFENASLVERFLNYWRTTGHQRIGFLYGRYEAHSDVPLGIRATVAAIYEPPQEGSRDLVRLLPDEREELVEDLASQLGLRKVGWIFTDLLPHDSKQGAVKHCRNIQSHFLTAQECITAGHFQNQQPNPCRFSPNGFFGSKFVTVCVTGDASNQVHMEGYSVSNQCMALVRDNCLLPTKDAPELGYVRESSGKQYVPDVFYKETDGYGNEVSRMARPLPVEYLLVDVPASTPLTPQFTFLANSSRLNDRPFPIENRLVDGHIQDFNALCSYMQQFGLCGEESKDDFNVIDLEDHPLSKTFLAAISDFHLLLYIATMDTLPLREYMGPLLSAVRDHDAGLAWEWSRSGHWATVEQLMIASASNALEASMPEIIDVTPSGGIPRSSSFSAVEGIAPPVPPLPAPVDQWTCNYCTFANEPQHISCAICNLPR